LGEHIPGYANRLVADEERVLEVNDVRFVRKQKVAQEPGQMRLVLWPPVKGVVVTEPRVEEILVRVVDARDRGRRMVPGHPAIGGFDARQKQGLDVPCLTERLVHVERVLLGATGPDGRVV